MGNDSDPEQEDNNARLAHYLDLLSDENPGNRWKAAISLGRLKDLTAVDALISALGDEDDRVRIKAIWALGEMGDARAIPSLKKLYRIERDDIRENISEAVDAINRAAGDQQRTGE
jgi:HEAT repeat protein